MASTNSVEIVISANDRASSVIGTVMSQLGGIGEAASLATTPVQVLGRAIVSSLSPAAQAVAGLGTSMLNPFSALQTVVVPLLQLFDSLTGSVANLSTTFSSLGSNPILLTAFTSILASAEQEVESLTGTLSEKLSAVGEVGIPLLNGMGLSAQRLGGSFGSVAAAITSRFGPAIDAAVSGMNRFLAGAGDITERLSGTATGIANVFEPITGLNEPLLVLDLLKNTLGGVAGGIFQLTQEIAFFSAGLDAIKQLVISGPFELLIQQNVRLQEQLLATKATIVATNQVLDSTGKKILDPTQAIQSLNSTIDKQIKTIREGSLELVGVTSNQLVDTFSIIAGQVGNIGISLDQASQLTLSIAASLGTIGLPLEQARQEVTSLLQGTIDQNSILAKTLGITNQQVNTWKSQGRIFEELTKKLEPFRAGNALAAQSLTGVFSNIQEYVEEVARVAGEPLLAPLVAQLNSVYEAIRANKDGLTSLVSGIIKDVLRSATAVVDIVSTVFGSTSNIIAKIPIYLFRSLADFLGILAQSIKNLMPVIQPLITVFGQLIQAVGGLGGPFLTMFLQFKVASVFIGGLTKGFGLLANLLPGVGDLLFYLGFANNGLLSSFAGLRNQLGFGAAGFLLLGKNLAAIPGLAGLAASQIPIFGSAIASLAPSFASFGIQLVGVAKAYPAFGTFLTSATNALPALAARIAPLANSLIPGLGAQLSTAAVQLSSYTVGTNLATAANAKFSELTNLAGKAIVKQVVDMGLLVGAIGAGIFVFNEFILKNEGVQQALSSTGETLKNVGKAIYDFFRNPIVAATTAVVALAIAIRVGLISAVAQTIQSFTTLAATQAPIWAAETAKALQSLATYLRTTTIGTGMLSLSFFRLGGAQAFFMGTTIQLQGVLSRLTGQTLLGLGSALGKLNFTSLATSAGNAGLQMVLFGNQALGSAAAGRGFFNVSNLMNLSLSNLRAGLISTRAGFIALGKDILKTAGPLLILATAIAVVTENFDVYTKITSAQTAASKEFNEGIKETDETLAKLLRQKGTILPTDTDLAAARLKEIQGEQNLVGKGFDFIRGKIGVTTAAQAELNAETAGFGDAMQLAETKLNGFKQSTDDIVKLEAQRADLQKERAEASAVGNDSEIKDIDERIKKIDEELKARRDSIDASIKALEAQKPPTKAAAQDQANLIKLYKAYRDELDKKVAVKVDASELPRLGTLYEQLQGKAESALEAVSKSTGTPELFKQKATELIEVTQEQLKLNQITADQARSRFSAIAGNVNAEKDVQLKAQEAITQSYQTESQLRIDLIENSQKRVQASVTTGRVSELEGEKKLAVLREDALQEQLQSLEKTHNRRMEMLREEFNATLENLKVEESRIEALAAQQPEGSGKQKELLASADAVNGKITNLEKSFEGNVTKEKKKAASDRGKIVGEIEINAAESQKRQREIRIAQIERLERKAVDLATSAENERLIQIQQLENAGTISHAKAEEDRNKVTLTANKQELKSAKETLAALLKLPKSANPVDEEERQAQIRAARLKTQQATIQILSDEQKAYETHIATILEIVDREQTGRQIALQKALNTGTTFQSDVDTELAQQRVRRLQKEIAAETKNSDKRQKLQLELQKALGEADEAGENGRLSAFERGQTRERTALQKRINAGLVQEDEANLVKAQQDVDRIRKSLELEKNDKDERLKLEEQLQVALKGLNEAKTSSAIASLEREQTKRRTILQKQLNAGKITEAEISKERASQEVARIQEQLSLAVGLSDARLKLEEELQVAIGNLQDADIAERKIKLERQNQIYQNQIQGQTQALQRQLDLYDLLGKAIENRNKLIESGKNLAAAAAGFLTGELDILADLETSEYRRQKLSEAAANTRLQALLVQQQYERESLALQQQQNQLALDREATENRIAQGKALADIGKAASDLEIAKTDPKARPEVVRGLELQLGGLMEQFGQLGELAKIIEKQRATLPQLNAAENKALNYNQKVQERSAQAAIIKAASPGRQRPLTKILQQDIAEDLGQESYKGLLNASTVMSKQMEQAIFKGMQSGVNLLSAYDPGLEDLAGVLSPDQMSKAAASAQRDFGVKFGPLLGAASVTSAVPAGTKPLALPSDFSGLQLPPAELKQLGVQFQSSGSLFVGGVDKLIQAFKSGEVGKAVTVNLTAPITVQAQGDRSVAQKTGESVQDVLGRVIGQAQGIAKARR